MRALPTSLTAGRSCFDRSGQRLVLIENDALVVVDFRTSATRRIACARPRSIAAFDDQIWATTEDGLVRVDYAGRSIRACGLDAGDYVLIPALAGNCAAYTSKPSTLLAEQNGFVMQKAIDADLVLPITTTDHVVIREQRISMPNGAFAQLARGSLILGAALAAGGRSLITLSVHRGMRFLNALSYSTGAVTQQFAIAPGIVRVATERMIAVAQLGPRSIVVLDLETGDALLQHTFPHMIDDFTVSPDGAQLVMHTEAGLDLMPLLPIAEQREAA
ncbi:MAG: hypothetical protein QM831_28195 [Kofleriaceae bacterium]